MIQKINHIGIAVSSLNDQVPFYRDILGLTHLGTEEVPNQKVLVAMFRVGEVTIELLQPTDPESPVARFIEKHGEGLHHISYHVDDLEAAIAGAVAKGVEMIDPVPRPGAHGTRIAFMHPRSSGRVLTELTEE